ncbi:MAG: hypothetical protein KatS3mg129_0395 [Leptospiraceae bacterium]|nr:MAG: hypothetical protein KatS3mg129_0395 [Leptospiraceae bacterium]
MNYFLVVFEFTFHEKFLDRLIGTSLFLLQCFMIAYFFYLIEKKGLFRFFIILILLRILIIYIELFENLTLTGFGLIFLGILIIGLSFLYIKIEQKIKKEFKKI